MLPSLVSWLLRVMLYGAVTSFLPAQGDVICFSLVSWLLRIMSYITVTSFLAAQNDVIWCIS